MSGFFQYIKSFFKLSDEDNTHYLYTEKTKKKNW